MLVTDFINRATELGARVHPVSTSDEAAAWVVEIFTTTGSHKVVVAPELDELAAEFRENLARAGADFVDGDLPQALALADMGVTRAAMGIAETGTIVVAGNESLPRLATMLPLVHIALLEEGDLVPSLDEAGEYLRKVSLGTGSEQPRYVSFVGGPSRTSDVEKTLTVGAHGPGELHIILLG